MCAGGRQGGWLSRSYFRLIRVILRYNIEEADLTGSRHSQASKQQPATMSHECPGAGSQRQEDKHTVIYCSADRLKDEQTLRHNYRSY